jgi:(2R)-3-sulfolactate dehydrogenase (NADP+)
MAKAAGEPIPEGWAVDAEGAATTDPEAALAGSLVSMGGHKGWGFGLMAEILAAGLTGGVLSKDVKPLKAPTGAPHDLGQFYIVIDPATSPDFGAKLESLSAAANMDENARMPGQFKTPSDPVDVADAVWDQITALAQ